MQQRDFLDLVTNAYHQLYDFVQLRTSPLADLLVDDVGLSPKEKGWRLHRVLLEALNELSPADNAPVQSREWRRHRIMTLRFVDALEPQQAADRLAISKRQFYRDLGEALQNVADILWNRRRPDADLAAPEPGEATNVDLLHTEMTRLAHSDSRADVGEVLGGVLALLKGILEDHAMEVRAVLPGSLPTIRVGRNALRQTLLGLIGFLVNRSRGAALAAAVLVDDQAVRLELRLTPPLAAPPGEDMQWLDSLSDLLRAEQGDIRVCSAGPNRLHGFDVTLPREAERAVLVVDDNADMLALYERFLSANGYRVLTACHASAALEIAHQAQPVCVFLDLMMPDQDGWELLQALRADPRTARLPAIVCSVLKQQDLALALGAAAFLEKPITEQALLGALLDVVGQDKP